MAGIKTKFASRRTPVRTDQTELLALLLNELIRARQASPGDSMDDFTRTPEYRRFLIGAYACNFVCSDLAPMQHEPEKRELETAPFNIVRHWIHHLLRSERWNNGFWSPIMSSIDDGRLTIVTRRLESGEFVEPHMVIEEETQSA